MHFLFLNCSGSACSECTEDSDLSTVEVSENFLGFYFPFFQILTIISSSFFLKLVISSVIFGVFFQLTVIIHYNHPYMLILANDAMYVHFLLFPISLSPFTLQIPAIHKTTRSFFISL